MSIDAGLTAEAVTLFSTPRWWGIHAGSIHTLLSSGTGPIVATGVGVIVNADTGTIGTAIVRITSVIGIIDAALPFRANGTHDASAWQWSCRYTPTVTGIIARAIGHTCGIPSADIGRVATLVHIAGIITHADRDASTHIITDFILVAWLRAGHLSTGPRTIHTGAGVAVFHALVAFGTVISTACKAGIQNFIDGRNALPLWLGVKCRTSLLTLFVFSSTRLFTLRCWGLIAAIHPPLTLIGVGVTLATRNWTSTVRAWLHGGFTALLGITGRRWTIWAHVWAWAVSGNGDFGAARA